MANGIRIRLLLVAALFPALLWACASMSAQTAAGGGMLGRALLTLKGRGVQVYGCAAAGGAAAWVLDHPEADLLSGEDKVVGHHDAGPAWHLDDGSSVEAVVVEKTPAPSAGDIPWLVLRATTHKGSGALSAVETIRRTETAGGIAPRQGCDVAMVGATVRVPYSATYSFFGKAGK